MKWLVRIVLGIVVLVLVALLALFAAGRRPGAGSTASSIVIERPPAEVWTWITEPGKVKQWVGWLVEIKDVPEGPPQVGHSEIWVMDDPNTKQRIEMRGTLTAVEPYERLALVVDMPKMFTGDYQYLLADRGGKTELRLEGRFKYTDPFAAFMEPIVTPEALKKERADLATLKRLAESAPVPQVADAEPDSAATP